MLAGPVEGIFMHPEREIVCSIVIATRNKCDFLRRTLISIREQNVSFGYEIIVVDDGSTDETRRVCMESFVHYLKLDNDRYRNPAKARNIGYRLASGEIIVSQSDEVLHVGGVIESLCAKLKPGKAILATVYNYDWETGQILNQMCGEYRRKPLFFLGSIWKNDIYRIGGNDEEFAEPGYEDVWFADCLEKGAGVEFVYDRSILGLHQNHYRSPRMREILESSRQIYERKVMLANSGKIPWCSSGGPWI